MIGKKIIVKDNNSNGMDSNGQLQQYKKIGTTINLIMILDKRYNYTIINIYNNNNSADKHKSHNNNVNTSSNINNTKNN